MRLCQNSFHLIIVSKRIRDSVLYTFNYQPFHQQTIQTIG